MDYTVINIETAANPDYKGPQLAKRGEEKPGLSPITGKVIAFGYKRNGGALETFTDSSEKAVITTAASIFNISKVATVITFNGKQFDVPFLAVRAAVLGVKFNFASVLRRYSDEHIDVYEVLNSYRTPAKGSLKHWCHTFGVTMQEGDGEDMQTWYDTQNYEAIKAHNQSTLKATDEIFRRIAFPLLGIKL